MLEKANGHSLGKQAWGLGNGPGGWKGGSEVIMSGVGRPAIATRPPLNARPGALTTAWVASKTIRLSPCGQQESRAR